MRRLDTLRTIQTPEGVVLTLRAAGPVIRSLAWMIDVFVRTVIYVVAAMSLLVLGEAGLGLLLVFAFMAEWFYPVVFEVLNRGQTPGKMALGIAVVHEDGTPVTLTDSILRNLLRAADFLPFAYLSGFIAMCFTPDFRRLGDLAAGTLVVYRERLRPSPGLPEEESLAPPVPLHVEEQGAILAFAERCGDWTPERGEELAEILEPMAGHPPSAAVKRLHGMARYLMGVE